MISEIRADMEAQMASEDSAPSATTDVSPTPEGVDATPESTSPEPPAASQPSETGAAPVPPPGPIPFERHKAVLEEARAKYAWVDKYGDPTTVQQRLAVTEWAERDPVGFLRTYAANQGIDPRTLFPQPDAAAPPPPDPMPEPDVLWENGQQGYSAEKVQRLLDLREQQLLARVNQELAPIKQERAVSQLQQQSYVRARQQLEQAKAWPGFSEHEADLKQFLVANPTATLHDAYIHVVPAKLAAKAQAAETGAYQKALTDLQLKAGAASIPAPRTSGATAVDTSKMSFRELLEQAYDG